MLNAGDTLHLSASDLVGHLNCRYLTSLDLAVANGTLAKPFIWDPVLEVLAERGALHEQDYVDHLQANGLSVTAIDGVGVDSSAVTQTLEAMKAGAQIIVQGALKVGRWSGRADILRRVEKPSHLGSWSYEVVDTKLARETKGSTVLQICLYSELVAVVQERVPEFAYVVTPGSDLPIGGCIRSRLVVRPAAPCRLPQLGRSPSAGALDRMSSLNPCIYPTEKRSYLLLPRTSLLF